MSPGPAAAQRRRSAAARTPLDVLRGALIGAAEVVPGVSGGTIALVVGVYETLIGSAGHLVSALRYVVTGHRARAAAEVAQVRWGTVLPVGVGMVTAVVVGAALLEPVLEEHPVGSRAVFAGLICASLLVPIRMVGRWEPRLVALAVAAATVAAVLTGLPPGSVADPSPVLVVGAAAVAVCALVLPGVSGSFLLLTFGMYEATLGAVNERDLPYLGAFVLGALLGLSLFVKVLEHLLRYHRAPTLAMMTGLMAGSLRALWPWQTEDRDLLAPTGDVVPVLLLAAAGAAAIVLLLVVETRLARR